MKLPKNFLVKDEMSERDGIGQKYVISETSKKSDGKQKKGVLTKSQSLQSLT